MNQIYNFFNCVQRDFDIIYSNKLILLILILAFIYGSYTDLKEMKIYNKFNILLLILRIVIIFIPGGMKITLSHIVGMCIGFFALLIPAMALMHKMGGDIKFMAVIGLYLGGYLTFITLVIACIYNLIYFICYIWIFKKFKKKVNKPFAPFLTLAFLTLIFVKFLI